MDIVVTGRHCTVSPQLRELVSERLTTIERLRDRVIRVEAEFSASDNTKDPSDAVTVQLTLRSRGPVLRAAAKASDKTQAFEKAVDPGLSHRHRAENQRPVRDRLVARDAHDALERGR